jgi:hypothetical protein
VTSLRPSPPRAHDLLQHGIQTFVIGFQTGSDSGQLDAIAQAGGTGMNTYITADDQTELQDALDTIVSSVISCTYELDSPDASADPDKVNFQFDGEVVPYDEDCVDGGGWHWLNDAHTKTEFCPDACDTLRTGEISEVTATFGCPTQGPVV